MAKKDRDALAIPERRKFFGAVAAGAVGAVAISTPDIARAQEGQKPAKKPAAAPPNAATAEHEAGTPPQEKEPVTVGKAGSDYMVDCFKSMNIDYVALMPGSSFRALHESVINYGENKKPELIACLHEEIAVSMAHGYAKVAGKPMLNFVHSVVGLQHASMSIYNAWADRVPLFICVGNGLDAMQRAPNVEWAHSAQDNAAIVRDFSKWDDQPISLGHFTESAARAYTLATTPPFGPTLLVVDEGLGEEPVGDKPPPIAPVNRTSPPGADPNAIDAFAKMLVGAKNPVLIAGRLVRTEKGMQTLVELAETLGCAVVDQGTRMNFPSMHPLNMTWNARRLIPEADVVLGLEVVDLYGAVHGFADRIERRYTPRLKPGTKLISIDSLPLLIRPNFQDFQRYQPVDMEIVADGETALPQLLEAVKKAMPKGSANVSARADKIKKEVAQTNKRNLAAAANGWDASPISTARFCAEIWGQIKGDDKWGLVTPHQLQSHWQIKLWNMTKPWHHIGDNGGYGVGYQPGAAMGAAIAHRDAGRFAIAIFGDGDLMCNPGALWTAAHHKLPILMIVHNNRAYHQEVMHIQRMADRHARGIDRAHIGTEIANPNIDFAKLAQSMGVWAEGPISDPSKLGPALSRALAQVRKGEPALLDVVSQPR
ncbi:MAG TPA: thiamine pyrophosphate-dependent enzyme [Stellaceae bacterium]|nr:thiamine pyrophosphate-dependent enzyme [Stellaceae bacterium]